MRARLAATAALVALSAAACHRAEEPEKAADLSPLCAAPTTLEALKAALLPAQGGRRYLARLKTARVTLSEVHAVGFDPELAHCTADAELISPVVQGDAQATQELSYDVKPDQGNGPRLLNLQVAGGGDAHAFAELLRHPKLAEAPATAPTPPPSADNSATVEAAALDQPPEPPPATPRRSFSAQTQSLIDQAGDTRTAPAADAPSRTPDANALNSIAGTY